MSTRQRRLYETAFDSRVKRDVDDIDSLMQSPVLQGDLFRNRAGDGVPVARAASRSSFGSTSGSSASSTPTHQARNSPRHFTPTERRKVTLIRDLARHSSPQNRIELRAKSYDRNKVRNNQWDNVSRCSDKSSSQESMNVVDPKEDFRLTSNNCKNEQLRNFVKSASRDNILFRDDRRNLASNHVSDLKDLTSVKLENSNGFHKNGKAILIQNKEDGQDERNHFMSRKNSTEHTVLKVVPTDNACLLKSRSKTNPAISDSVPGLVLKENTSQNVVANVEETRRRERPARPFSLLSESRPLDNVQQSPDNDHRPSEDYDPPWEFKSKALRSSVNGSISVPERLSQPPCDSSSTRENQEGETSQDLPDFVTKALPLKHSGPSCRTNLNLNLNLNSDSPRKARQTLTLNFGCAALSAVGEKVDVELTLEKQGWYHGSISRLDAENLLRVLKEGSYLVRNSESSKQDYSLSLKSARGFMHMKIVHSDGRFILGQFSNPFSSIPEMIHHYSINKLPIKGAEHMSLLYPVIDQLL